MSFGAKAVRCSGSQLVWRLVGFSGCDGTETQTMRTKQGSIHAEEHKRSTVFRLLPALACGPRAIQFGHVLVPSQYSSQPETSCFPRQRRSAGRRLQSTQPGKPGVAFSHQTPFDPHNNRYEPYKPLLTL